MQLSDNQKKFYKKMGDFMKSKNLTHRLWEGMLEQDPMMRYYLSRRIIEDVILKNEFKMNDQYFNILFSPLEQNTNGDYSYK